MARASLVVGVDAGGSGVDAVALEDATVVGRGSAGPANLRTVGVETAAAEIVRAVGQAVEMAHADSEARNWIAAVYVGAAGAGAPAAAAALREALREVWRNCGADVRTTVVEDDTRIALRSAIPKGPGIVLIAGTGSVAYAESGAERFRVGGGGYLLGDEGSGFAIGLAAARYLLRFYDGRELAGAMSRALERNLGVTSREELLEIVYGASPAIGPDVARVASLAKEVLALAADGEVRASAIVEEAAGELCVLAVHASERLRLVEPRIALAGGLLSSDTPLTRLVQASLNAALPGCTFVAASEPAAFAAARLAADAVIESR